jgi:hypothetical protein
MTTPWEVNVGVDDTLSLAAAMARRQLGEESKLQAISAETLGREPDVPSIALQTAIVTGTTKVMLDYLKEPEHLPSTRESLATVLDDTTLDLIWAETSQGDADGDNELLSENEKRAVKESVINALETFSNVLGPENLQLEETKKSLEVARSISDRHSVSISQVYDDDALYEELVRSIDSPLSFARTRVERLARIDEELLQTFFASLIEPLVRLDAEELGGQTTVDEEIELAKAELKDQPEVIEMVEKAKHSGRVAIIYQLKRFWGDEALAQLPDDIRQVLK